mgnify:CR=1 FL=1
MVAEALRQLNSEKEMWHLERICEEVPCRGHAVGDGMGQGFFVCVFVRDSGIPLSEAERKKKEKEYMESLKEPEAPVAPTEQKKVIVEKTKKRMKNSKVDQEKKALKEKKTQQNISTSINYALRAQQEHPGKHKKKIPLGKSY